MNVGTKKKVVVLGMMSKKPVAGVVWQTVHYLVGFQRLGYEVYYAEAHASSPTWFMNRNDPDGSRGAAAFIAAVMRRFDLATRWAFQALHSDGCCYGLTAGQLAELYRSADLIINLNGATVPRPEHSATGRLVFLETDPVALQIELSEGRSETDAFLAPHCAFFTFGENYGNPDCLLPVSSRFEFRPTRQPIIEDFWAPYGDAPGATFTTIGNWQQEGRDITFQGVVYHWSKHHEFLKILDLPQRTGQAFELALGKYDDAVQGLLEAKGWRVWPALDLSHDLDKYRAYIAGSRGEFTAAKDQNIRLRSGWFSDRSATYLAAGRPVITQETGFSNMLPTGEGLFAFSTLAECIASVECINADYDRHRRAAATVARDYFNYDVVLTQLLSDVGM